MLYTERLGQSLVDAFSASDKVSMYPKEVRLYPINEEYTLRVYCYAWMVRRYSVRDNETNECVCLGNTQEWVYYEFTSY